MKVKVKQKGSMLIAAIITTILYIFISSSFVVIATGGAGMIGASRVALQAQQYAEIDADILHNIDYEELDTYGVKDRQAMPNVSEPNWEHEIRIAAEASIPGSDAKQRIATIHIYKKDDTLPRFTLEVPLTSQGSGGSLPLPIGTILPYVGDLNKIPKGWYLCNGENDTPNLISGRFLQGSTVKGEYINAGIPNIKGFAYATDDAFVGTVSGPFGIYSSNNNWNWDENNYPHGILVDFDASRSSSVYRNDINTVQPAAYTVYYIIRLK